MRVLVTGATGFIGAYCVDELLKRGDKVIATGRDREGLEYYRHNSVDSHYLDVTNEADFEKIPDIEIDAVIHSAGLVPSNVHESDYDPRKYVSSNTLGTLNVLEFCRKRNIKTILYTHSHSDVEGHWDSGRAISSDAVRSISYVGDHSAYIISKNAAVDFISHYQEQHSIRGIIFRLPPVYGYGPHTEIFKDGKYLRTGFGRFLDAARSGEPIEIWGDSEMGRDIVSVRDVADAAYMAIHTESARGIYNIASGERLTLEREVDEIVRAFSPADMKAKIIHRKDKKNSIRPFLYDISKARSDFGYSPSRSFKDILLDYKLEEQKGRLNFLIKHKRESR